jgi:hypothetical protein
MPAASALLVLLALLGVALVAPARGAAPVRATHASSLASPSSAHDDGRTFAAAPGARPEWLVAQLRGGSASEPQLAVLLASVALGVAARWRRRRAPVTFDRNPLRTPWSASRAPPAFA